MGKVKTKQKSTKGGLLIILVAGLLLLPQVAFAQTEGEIEQQADGQISVEYRYKEGDEVPVIPKETTYNDASFGLVDTTSATEDPIYQAPTKQFASTLTQIVEVAGEGRWQEYFPASVAINEGGFIGEVPLDPNSFIVSPVYETVSREYNSAPVVVEGLPTNDVNYLDSLGYATATYTTTSDSAPGATMQQILTRIAPVYEVTATDADGRPTEYRATLVYRGEERHLMLVNYEVTAQYGGEVVSNERQYLIEATYGEVVIEDAQTPLAQAPESFPWALAGLLVGTFVVFGSTFFIIWWRQTRMRVVKEVESRSQVIRHLRMKMASNRYLVDIPVSIDLSEDTYWGYIPLRIVRRGAGVTVAQNGTIIYDRPPVRKIRLYNRINEAKGKSGGESDG